MRFFHFRFFYFAKVDIGYRHEITMNKIGLGSENEEILVNDYQTR
jgi:hypothetical protein